MRVDDAGVRFWRRRGCAYMIQAICEKPNKQIHSPAQSHKQTNKQPEKGKSLELKTDYNPIEEKIVNGANLLMMTLADETSSGRTH